MELEQMRERILSTPLVQKLPEGMRLRFAMILLGFAETREVAREEQIFKQGDRDAGTGCIIIEGMVRIITEEDNSKTIEAPDILGEVQIFTPDRVRTATVEVVVGGKILVFSWKEVGAASQEIFSADEMKAFRKVIAESAWTREKSVFEKK